MAPFIRGAVPSGSVELPAAAAIGFLGVFGTGIASILYFRLVSETGARFTSLLNYLVPVWAVALGALVLDEQLSVAYWLGLLLLLAGLVLISRAAIVPVRKTPAQEPPG